MNKKLLIIMVLIFTALTVHSNEIENQGIIKAGVSVGYPLGLTAGWSPSDIFELNLLVGTNYTGFTVGLSPLFTLVDINIADQPLPLSFGPALNLNIMPYGLVDLDILAVLRLEYTLPKIPLNFFIEGGAGVNVNFYSSAFYGLATGINPVRFAGAGAIGVRYVF